MAVWHELEATGVCQLSSKVSIRKLFYDMFRGVDCVAAVDTGPVVDGKYSFKLHARFNADGDIDVREFLRRIKAIHVDAVLHYHILL